MRYSVDVAGVAKVSSDVAVHFDTVAESVPQMLAAVDSAASAMQAPNDINKNFDGVQVENWGYAITPTAGNGITELPSGIPGTSSATLLAGVVSPALGIYLEGSSQLEHHNQVISGNPNRNSTVLRNIRDILNAKVQRQ